MRHLENNNLVKRKRSGIAGLKSKPIHRQTINHRETGETQDNAERRIKQFGILTPALGVERPLSTRERERVSSLRENNDQKD